ncbi:c-type cytochrome [Microvirga massiliensis]|uniref:c-type cytochrome n=1 Tax=Microvirga massiliensis TaxID=1033741 RepID=UPI000AD2620D|nr:cytochrome c [Microvirga massiliensis]
MDRRLHTLALAGLFSTLPVIGIGLAETDFNQIQRGKYLVSAGDCFGCHTDPNGKPFAGGRPLQTPFGTIYSANITPDREIGIGAWSDEDFYRALHEGVSADGSRLYPAFPYPYYTHVTREDVQAIRAYLQTIEPAANTPPRNKLPFPLSERALMRPWNWMFFDDDNLRPDPQKSAAWNRGAYLVEGLGHCGACHTPKNILGADKESDALQGASLQNWFAPSLGSDLREGLHSWTEDDVVEYLQTGRNRRSNASGPMAEVVEYSTSHLTSEDLRAIATYLKDLPHQNAAEANRQSNQPSIDVKVAHAGEAIFLDQCSACHRSNGEGIPTFFPPLRGNANVQQQDPTTVVRVILGGTRSVPTSARPTPLSMPAFGWKLTDDQIAAVATYVRNHWGNAAPAVSSDQVADLRKAVHANAQ